MTLTAMQRRQQGRAGRNLALLYEATAGMTPGEERAFRRALLAYLAGGVKDDEWARGVAAAAGLVHGRGRS